MLAGRTEGVFSAGPLIAFVRAGGPAGSPCAQGEARFGVPDVAVSAGVVAWLFRGT
jgi:hypothetical protein